MPDPILTDLSPSVTFDEAVVNVTPQLLDADVSLVDPDNDFDGGALTIAGLLDEDIVSIRDEGSGAGQIGFDEFTGEVFYGGVLIGVAVGGCGCEPLSVEFNGDATAEAIDALIQNLTYANSSDAPTESRTILLNVYDATGADLGLSGLSGFTDQPGRIDPFHDVGVYAGSTPVFGDLDGDGDFDLVVGDVYGDLHFFENVGDASAPEWVEATDAANPFDAFPAPPLVTPTLVDLDGDGDLDLVAGALYGLGYLENVGDADTPVFLPSPSDVFEDISDPLTAPAFADLDGDGDYDLVLGNAYGDLKYFENVGDASTPDFVERTDAANPFDGVDLGYYSRPVLADVDGDGDIDAVVADRYGDVAYFENTGDSAAPVFTQRIGALNPFDGVNVGYVGAPALADLDGDGDLDLVMGNVYGDLPYFVNGPSRGRPITVHITPADDPAQASDDFVDADETSVLAGDLFAGNSGPPDFDFDGPALSIIEVNGSAVAVGVQITLASGALLTVNADGTYSYDPNGMFNALPGGASGASNQTATDTFTYTLDGGSTATVTVFVLGEDTDGDVLQGASGFDALDGGSGDDTVDYGSVGAGVVVKLNGGVAPDDGDGGSDTLVNIENVIGSAFDDLLVGDGQGNVLTGGDGRDTLLGLDGNDTLIGGAGLANQLQGGLGDDTYVVTAGDTVVELAGQGVDTILTDRTGFTLVANVENLTYTGAAAFRGVGTAAANVITGGTGDDVLIGRGGDDALNGGLGVDLADYSAAAGGVTASLTSGLVANDGDGGADALDGIENLTGSAFADVLTGEAGVNVLTGGLGDDVLAGRGGADLLYGGAGSDTADYGDAVSGVTVKLNGSVTLDDGDGATDALISIENAAGSAFNDLLIGSSLANVLNGGLGADTLIGLDGNDTLIGGGGAANTLQGGLGDDVYVVSANDTVTEFVGEGTDTVQTDRAAYNLSANVENLVFTGSGAFHGGGNALANIITGGAGADTLVGGQGNDTLNGGGDQDVVVVTGVMADYAIVDLGGGSYRITDSVGGRDGVDVTTGVESIRFSGDNSTASLASLAPPDAPLLPSSKGEAGPLVLPAIDGEAFLMPKGHDGALVLPSAFDPAHAATFEPTVGGLMLSLFDADGPATALEQAEMPLSAPHHPDWG